MKLSKFGYGTAALHHVAEKERIKLIKHALDCGITHFDTAPYYGYGICERALSFLSQEDITITTKFGIEVKGGNDQSYLQMFLRKAFGKILPSLDEIHYDFSIKNAEKSLEGSLRRLKRDKIDFLMIHEPSLDLINKDEIHRWLEDKILQGKILNFGVAGDKFKVQKVLTKAGHLSKNIQTNIPLDELKKDLKIDSFFRYGWIKNRSKSDVTEDISHIKTAKSDFFKQCHLFSSLKISTINKYRS